MDATLVDDDRCTIKVVGKGVYREFPSVVLELTNKADETTMFVSEDRWTAGGTACSPELMAPLRAGETCSVIMLFYPEEVGSDPSVLTDVSGKIMLSGPVDKRGYSPVLASYDVAF